MVLNIDAKFEGKRTCAFKNDMRNLVNFYQIKFESPKIGTLMGSFYPKQKINKLKICRGVCVMKMKNDPKFEQELTCQFKIDMRQATQMDKRSKILKICTLMGCC